MVSKYLFSGTKELVRLESKFDPQAAKAQLLDLGYKNGMSFLDIGSGGGAMTRLAAKYSPKNRVAGIDVDGSFISYAKEMANKQRLKSVVYFKSDVYSLPFPDNSFDFVWSRFLFEYLKDPIAALKEIRRVVKKNGIIAVGDLDGNCLFNYPIDRDLDGKLCKIAGLLAKKGFDPFVGRKLFWYFRKSGLRDINVKIYPYHNIFGKIDKGQLVNWKMKNESIMKALGNSSAKKSPLNSFSSKFIEYLRNENTFTYSVLIFVKGTK